MLYDPERATVAVSWVLFLEEGPKKLAQFL